MVGIDQVRLRINQLIILDVSCSQVRCMLEKERVSIIQSKICQRKTSYPVSSIIGKNEVDIDRKSCTNMGKSELSTPRKKNHLQS